MHTIRLRHPWQCEPGEQGCRWLRPFNWPAGILPQESVRLVIEGLPPEASVHLNGTPIRPQSGEVYDITGTIQLANRLMIECQGQPQAGNVECPFNVRLEIEATD